jgi:hypothetical protein
MPFPPCLFYFLKKISALRKPIGSHLVSASGLRLCASSIEQDKKDGGVLVPFRFSVESKNARQKKCRAGLVPLASQGVVRLPQHREGCLAADGGKDEVGGLDSPCPEPSGGASRRAD